MGHELVDILGGFECCGLREVYALNNERMKPQYIVAKAAALHRTANSGAWYVLTEAKAPHWTNNGKEFAEYVRRNGLGAISYGGIKRNPNSGNLVKCWIWAPNWVAIGRLRRTDALLSENYEEAVHNMSYWTF